MEWKTACIYNPAAVVGEELRSFTYLKVAMHNLKILAYKSFIQNLTQVKGRNQENLLKAWKSPHYAAKMASVIVAAVELMLLFNSLRNNALFYMLIIGF